MRAYVHPSEWSEEVIHLTMEESHHVIDVLRMAAGDEVELFDGQGRVARTEIVEISGKQVSVRVRDNESRDPPMVSTVLIQALAKGQKMDLIIQKATELEVSVIYPVEAERSVVKFKKGQGVEKSGRWDKIAINAAKQCGASWLPIIEPVLTIADWIHKHHEFDLLLLGDLSEDARPLYEVLAEKKKKPVNRVGIIIGPEGDFTPGEKNGAMGVGAVPVNLGPTTLRTETAALYALSVLRYEFGDR